MDRREDKKMTFEDKLDLIDHEIRTLHHFCVTKSYDPVEVERSAEPLLGAIRKVKRRRLVRNLAKAALVLSLGLALFYYDPAYKILCCYSKLAAIQVLPYWDWTILHQSDCLVENPYFVGPALLEEDCELCEHLEHINRVRNVSQTVFMENYLKRDIPVIVADAMDDWVATEQFNIQFLDQLFKSEDILKEILPCMFASNVRVRYGNPVALLNRAAQGDITNWYAHWENCDKAAAKILRQFYKRPYFIPTTVEMAEPNWLFIASQYQGKKNKPADIGLPMMWMAQVKGQIKVILTPRPPCNASCPILYNTLHEGDMLVVTDNMWLLDYMPVSSGDTIAIGAGGYFE